MHLCLFAADNKWAVSYIPRKGWHAQPPHKKLHDLSLPVPYALVSHTADSGQCSTTDECCSTMQTVQKLGFNDRAYMNTLLFYQLRTCMALVEALRCGTSGNISFSACCKCPPPPLPAFENGVKGALTRLFVLFKNLLFNLPPSSFSASF